MGTHARSLIETKVKASTLATFGVSVLIAVLNVTAGSSDLLGSLPSWLQTIALVAIPSAVTFLSGWKAKHTPRPDLYDGTPEVK